MERNVQQPAHATPSITHNHQKKLLKRLDLRDGTQTANSRVGTGGSTVDFQYLPIPNWRGLNVA